MRICSKSGAKTLLFVFNVLFSLSGLGVLTLGLYVILTGTGYDDVIGSELIPTGSYLLIGGGLLVSCVSLIGCAGTILESRLLLSFYTSFLLLVFLIEGAAGVAGFVFHDKVRLFLEDRLKIAMMSKYGFDDFQHITNVVDQIQQQLKCCGMEAPSDWELSVYYQNDVNKTIPVSCCRNINKYSCNLAIDTDVFNVGCVRAMETFVMHHSMLIGAVGISVGLFVQIVGLAMAVVILCQRNKDSVMSIM